MMSEEWVFTLWKYLLSIHPIPPNSLPHARNETISRFVWWGGGGGGGAGPGSAGYRPRHLRAVATRR